jgi:hypothetical protein
MFSFYLTETLYMSTAFLDLASLPRARNDEKAVEHLIIGIHSIHGYNAVRYNQTTSVRVMCDSPLQQAFNFDLEEIMRNCVFAQESAHDCDLQCTAAESHDPP